MKRSEHLKHIFLNLLYNNKDKDWWLSSHYENFSKDLINFPIHIEYVNGIFEKHFDALLNQKDSEINSKNETVLGINKIRDYINICYLNFDKLEAVCRYFEISETNFKNYSEEIHKLERIRKLERIKSFQNTH